MRRFLFLLSTLAIAAATPGTARADEDLLTSIYTAGGLELTRDERIFTLFSAFNAAGYDRAEETRSLPFPRRSYHPIREKIRSQLAAGGEKVRAPAEQFIDGHPVAVEAWVEAALSLGGAPGFEPEGKLPTGLAGLDQWLARFHKVAGLEKIGRATANDYRAELKRLSELVDGPFNGLRAAYRLDEEVAPVLTLVPNPLDAADAAYAGAGADAHVVVFGLPSPGRPVDLAPALRAYSALLAREAAKEVPAVKLKELEAPLKAAGLLSGTDVRAVIAGSLQAAVAAKLWNDSRAVDEGLRGGFAFARAFRDALGADAQPTGGLVADLLSRIDVARAVAEARSRR